MTITEVFLICFIARRLILSSNMAAKVFVIWVSRYREELQTTLSLVLDGFICNFWPHSMLTELSLFQLITIDWLTCN